MDHEDKHSSSPTTLKALIERTNLTEAELSHRVGVGLRIIQDWKKGLAIPRFDRAVSLASELGVSLKALAKSMEISIERVPNDAEVDQKGTSMDLIVRQRFAQAVKELRDARSHRQFAQIVGVSPSTIGLWERGEVSPSRDNLARIALIRGETMDEFVDYLEGRTSQPFTPEEKLLKQIEVASPSQLALILKAIALRLEPVEPDE